MKNQALFPSEDKSKKSAAIFVWRFKGKVMFAYKFL